jgi:hypothetical protein
MHLFLQLDEEGFLACFCKCRLDSQFLHIN